jgi:hypothetical protein
MSTTLTIIDISDDSSDNEYNEHDIRDNDHSLTHNKNNTATEVKIIRKDRDKEQMIKVYVLFLIEIFKVAMASFLSMSVIQNCSGEVCSYSQNIQRHTGFGQFVVTINAINIVAFAILYFFEFNREMFLIKYLDIDKQNGDYYLPMVLDNYINIKENLVRYNNIYYICTRSLLLLTSINWILSGILVFGSFYSFTPLEI